MDIFLLSLIAASLVYYSKAAAFARYDKKRIMDILIIAVLLYTASILEDYVQIDRLKAAAFLIFAYGWMILIVEKLWEGLKDNS